MLSNPTKLSKGVIKVVSEIKENIRQALLNYHAKPLGKQQHFSVLIPLFEKEGEWHILYEVRSHLISQPGDTSFPGGKVEENESYCEAAIRETVEELQIDANQIEIIGELDYIVNDGIIIHSFVGLLNEFNFEKARPNEEVAYLFPIKLDFLMNNQPCYYPVELKVKVGNDFPYHLMANGENYQFRQSPHAIPFYDLPNGEFLWGYTANLTHRFIEIIQSQD